MKKKLTIILMTILVTMSFAQDYKIEDFLPDSLTTWQVQAFGGISGTTNSREDVYEESENSGTEFQVDPEVRFDYKKIRKMYEMNYTIRSGFGLSFEEEEGESRNYFHQKQTNETNTNRSNFSIYGDFNNTKYITENFGLVGDVYLSTNRSTINAERTEKVVDSKNTTDQKSTNIHFNFQVNPGISFGRQYAGKYSAKAMEILGELRKAGYLERELTQKEYVEFSQIVMDQYASYHYDSRIKKMELLEGILTYLKEKNVIPKDEIRPVLITEDICSYNNMDLLFDRKFGVKAFATGILGVQCSNNFNSSEINSITYSENVTMTDSENENTNNQLLTGVSTGILYSKILSWNLFYDLGVVGSFKKYKYNDERIYKNKVTDQDDKNKYDDTTNRLETDVYGNFYYQFNSRSIAIFSNSFRYTKYFHEYDKDKNGSKDYNSENYSFSSDINFIHFITPKFSINTGIRDRFEKRWNKRTYEDYDSKDAQWQNALGFSLDFNYYL